MCGKSYLAIFILYLSVDYVHQYQIPDVEDARDNKYEFFVFTQQWPATVCKLWKGKKSGNRCNFPSKRERWTVHGLWPSRSGDLGPQFCNKSWAFDAKEMKPILDDMKQAWTNIHEGTETYSFWRHEWEKHGTCSLDLEILNSQLKYFRKGIELNRKYSLSDMLSAADIVPSDTKAVTAKEVVNAVRAKTGKQPSIGCATIKKEKYVHELCICFNKKLNLIDCKSNEEGSCGPKEIVYPKS